VGPDAVHRIPAHACYINNNVVRGKKMMESIQAAFRRQGLVRVQEDRVLGGVIAGLGRRFGLEPWPARLLFVLVLMLIPGSQLLIYPILWILMPQATEAPVTTAWTKPTG
jgi:phage shock protein C